MMTCVDLLQGARQYIHDEKTNILNFLSFSFPVGRMLVGLLHHI